MAKNSSKRSDREIAYKVDRGYRSAKSGAAIGMILGALTSMLFSRWIPESSFGPVVLITASIFAVVFGLFFPMELSYRELGDDPDSISPEHRVNRLHSDTKGQN
jgi:Na+/proline symporter